MVELRIGGMVCPPCPANVEEALRQVEGVAGAHVIRATSTAQVTYGASRAKVVDLVKAIRTAGYSAGTASMRVGIKNMHCSSCVIRIDLALRTTPGVTAARANALAAVPLLAASCRRCRCGAVTFWGRRRPT